VLGGHTVWRKVLALANIRTDVSCNYHATLGQSTLTKFVAILHYSYLVLKMPALGGVLSLQANLTVTYDCEKESLALVEAFILSTRMDAYPAKSKKVPEEA
jgi:hypothetical protein